MVGETQTSAGTQHPGEEAILLLVRSQPGISHHQASFPADIHHLDHLQAHVDDFLNQCILDSTDW